MNYIQILEYYCQLQIYNQDLQLLTTLAMVCPFDVPEKQALLEAETLKARADLLIAMMEMAIHGEENPHESRH